MHFRLSMFVSLTGLDGAVAKLLANGMVGTGFASLYRLQSTEGRCKAAIFSLSLTTNN